MRRFRILYYRPAIDGKWIDNAISTWTRLWNLDAPQELICSHTEIWTPDEITGEFEIKSTYLVIPRILGACWSSTMGQLRSADTNTGSAKDKKGGVRKSPASEILHNPERWFYCQFEIPDANYKAMLWEMEDEVLHNQGYDMAMILNFFLPLGIGAKDKFICSEFVNAKAKVGFMEVKIYEAIAKTLLNAMSPLRSAKTLHNLGVDMHNLDGTILLKGKTNDKKENS